MTALHPECCSETHRSIGSKCVELAHGAGFMAAFSGSSSFRNTSPSPVFTQHRLSTGLNQSASHRLCYASHRPVPSSVATEGHGF